MKTTIRLVCFSLIASLSGCATDAGCAGDWCGTLVIAQGTDAESLFPPLIQSTNSIAIADLMFLQLADLSPSMNTVGDDGFAPRLAREWTRVDSLTVRFVIDSRARWQDDVPVSARDVAFTFAIYTDTILASPRATLLSRIASVTALGPDTVEFRFNSAYPEQVYDAAYHMRILPAHVLDTIAVLDLASHPLTRTPTGNGPFRLVRWEPDQYLELRADTNFYLGRPGLRRIIWRVTPDKEAAVAQLVTNEADLVENLRSPQNIGRAAAASHLQLVEYPTSAYMYLQFNLRDPSDRSRPHRLFGDRALRLALSYAVDRETIMQAVFGGFAEIAVAPVSQTLSIWAADLPRLDYDRARAEQMLDSLGWRDTDGDGIRDRDGVPLGFALVSPSSDNNRHAASVIIQEQLRQVGVALELDELEFNSLIERVPAGAFDLFFGFRGQDPTPSTIPEAWGSAAIGAANFGSFSNARFDALTDQAIAEFDRDRAAVLWRQAIAEIVADAPAIWLFSPRSVLAVHNRFDNITVRPDQWAATMWTWRVASNRTIGRDRAGE